MFLNNLLIIYDLKKLCVKIMARRCSIDVNKGVLVGNKVSHSNRKSKKRFLPNLQIISFLSDVLGKSLTLRITPSSARTIEHNEGIDNYLITTSSSKLTVEAQRLKKQIMKKGVLQDMSFTKR
jgi:large subunit ribosomal protein L28